MENGRQRCLAESFAADADAALGDFVTLLLTGFSCSVDFHAMTLAMANRHAINPYSVTVAPRCARASAAKLPAKPVFRDMGCVPAWVVSVLHLP